MHKDWQGQADGGLRRPARPHGPGRGSHNQRAGGTGELDDTIIIFLSDNGASDEALPLVELERFKERSDILRVKDARWPRRAHRKRAVDRSWRRGHVCELRPSLGQSFEHALPLLQAVDARGRIATPFIVHWPRGGLQDSGVVRAPSSWSTCCRRSSRPPALRILRCTGREILPYEGRSFLRALRGQAVRTRRCGSIRAMRRCGAGAEAPSGPSGSEAVLGEQRRFV